MFTVKTVLGGDVLEIIFVMDGCPRRCAKTLALRIMMWHMHSGVRREESVAVHRVIDV